MVKIAINGLGRIGRIVLRNIVDNHPNVQIAAVNDLTDPKVLCHLLKHDSVYGGYKKDVTIDAGKLKISDKKSSKEIAVYAEMDPTKLPWKDLKIDIVLECTGKFTKYDDAKKHLDAGAGKVVISAPSKDADKVPSFILGVNDLDLDLSKYDVVDMGSCTTNCLAPITKVLQENWGIQRGFMTTIHAYTNDQRILDFAHKDLRRARAAALNIIPTTTGAAKTIGKVIPALLGKLDGISLRVPTPTVSVVDLVCELDRDVDVAAVNAALEAASAKGPLKGILGFEKEPLVSTDFVGCVYSSVVDASLTMANGNLVKVISWYDNEWGYATRLSDFTELIGKKL
jgi:glyceraldehyde 3-phosphate dehydrogenase